MLRDLFHIIVDTGIFLNNFVLEIMQEPVASLNSTYLSNKTQKCSVIIFLIKIGNIRNHFNTKCLFYNENASTAPNFLSLKMDFALDINLKETIQISIHLKE